MPFTRDPESIHGGDAAILKGELTAADCRAIEKAGLSHVVISVASDVTKLSQINGLKTLHILAEKPVDLTPLSDLHQLQSLYVGGSWFGEISFAQLGELEVFRADMPAKRASLADVASAAKLRVAHGNFDDATLEALVQCPALQTLAVRLTKFSDLEWLGAASASLQALAFRRCTSLADLRGLQHVRGLKALVIQTCRKISNLDGLEGLRRLELLQLEDCGDIDSLDPLAKLAALKVVSFLGNSRVLDGRISVLDGIKEKASVRFIDRPGNDRRAAEFTFDFDYFAEFHAKYTL